jgi:hypothetical protein
MRSGCADARDRIVRVELSGWRGLPAGCRPSELFAELSDDTSEWAVRPLGEDFERAAFAVVDLPGYYRPTVSVRDGAVVMFDGMNPRLAGGLEALVADLGEPEARLDYHHGTLPVEQGEWVFPSRGAALFVDTAADTALHVALYAPVTLEQYLRLLRPHLGKTLRPRPFAGEAS